MFTTKALRTTKKHSAVLVILSVLMWLSGKKIK